MKSPKAFARSWGTDDSTILADLSALRINRKDGLGQVWTENRYPSPALLNSLLSEIYTFLVDWQKSGVLEFDASVQQGYSTGAVVLDVDGLTRQATVANAHLVLPQNDPTEACWTILFKDPVVATTERFGLVRMPGNGDVSPTMRDLVLSEMAPNIVSVATAQNTIDTDVADSAIPGYLDGKTTAVTLSSTTLTLTRDQSLEDVEVDLDDLFDGYARLTGTTFTRSTWVPTVGRTINNTHVATTGWARRHLLTLVVTASRTRSGLFQFANQLYASLVDTPNAIRTRAISPARLETRFSLSFGQAGGVGQRGESGGVGLKGERGDNVVGAVGDRGIAGVDASGFTEPANTYKGIPGIIGLKGGVGDAGIVGLRGGVGEVGDRGGVGDVGRVGEVGLQGISVQGRDGSVGGVGERGFVGERGLPGPSIAGPAGIPGVSGLDVEAPVFYPFTWRVRTTAGRTRTRTNRGRISYAEDDLQVPPGFVGIEQQSARLILPYLNSSNELSTQVVFWNPALNYEIVEDEVWLNPITRRRNFEFWVEYDNANLRYTGTASVNLISRGYMLHSHLPED